MGIPFTKHTTIGTPSYIYNGKSYPGGTAFVYGNSPREASNDSLNTRIIQFFYLHVTRAKVWRRR